MVLHPGLPDEAFDVLRRLHPRVVARRDGGLADLLRLTGYDTVVVLTPDSVVLGDIRPLLRLRHGVGAVPRTGADDVRGGLLDGLLVVQRADLDETLLARLAAGEDPATALEKVLTPVDGRYDFPAARLGDDLPVPADVAVLRFPAGPGAPASGPAAEARGRFETDDEAFRAAYCALPGEKHPDLLAHLAPPLLAARPSLDLARTVAEVHRRQGRYDEAVEVLAPVVGDRLDAPRCQETLGVCLMALSRYAEAEARLLLAAASPTSRPAPTRNWHAWPGSWGGTRTPAGTPWRAWTPTPPTPAVTPGTPAPGRRRSGRTAAPTAAGEPAPARDQLAHVALFAEGRENAGDKVLPEAVRLCFGPDTGPRRWYAQPVHRLVDEAALEELNARRGVVVGGGGLFLPDTSPTATATGSGTSRTPCWSGSPRRSRCSRSATTCSTASPTGAPGSRRACASWSSGRRSSACATTAPSTASANCSRPGCGTGCGTSPAPPRSPAVWSPAGPTRPSGPTRCW